MAKSQAGATAVAKVDGGSKLPVATEMEAFAGQGLENVTAKDVLIPRLTILQQLSPQVTKSKPEFNPDAKVGQFCDVGTGELFNPPLLVVPVYYAVSWLEWHPRATGKGLAAIYDTDEVLAKTTKNEKGRDVLPNGNLIVESAQFFLLNLNAGMRRSFIPFSSTQRKKAKRWLTLATSEKLLNSKNEEFTPPLFYRSYTLTTVSEQNPEGAWEGWKIERGDPIQQSPAYERILKEAIDFRKALQSGAVRAAMDDAQPEEGAAGAEGRM